MGIRESLRLIQGANALQEQRAEIGIRSPWSTTQLAAIVWSDILGSDELPTTRAEAMSVPALARGRHMLCTDIADLPLRVYKRDQEQTPAPAWLSNTKGATSPQHRMMWTVDDLIWSGWSLWAVERDTSTALGGRGAILDAVRVPPAMWTFGQDGVIEVNGEPVSADSVILIPGFHEGLLNFANRTIRGSRMLESQWVARVRRPIPATELHQTGGPKLENPEIIELLTGWKDALEEEGGALGFTPENIQLITHGDASADLLIQGRNGAAVDCARAIGVSAALLDASGVNSTLTYETMQGRNLEYVERSVSLYTKPIAARLSMDDVTTRGTRIAFDTSSLTGPFQPAGPTTED